MDNNKKSASGSGKETSEAVEEGYSYLKDSDELDQDMLEALLVLKRMNLLEDAPPAAGESDGEREAPQPEEAPVEETRDTADAVELDEELSEEEKREEKRKEEILRRLEEEIKADPVSNQEQKEEEPSEKEAAEEPVTKGWRQSFSAYMEQVRQKSREMYGLEEKPRKEKKKKDSPPGEIAETQTDSDGGDEEQSQKKKEKTPRTKEQKRRGWIITGIILAAVVALGAGIWIYLENPYEKPENWMLEQLTATKDVDCFYVGSADYHGDEINMSLGDEKERESYKNIAEKQIAGYEELCRVFAPYYRQASQTALLDQDAEKALDKAYKDIRRAFSYYRKEQSGKRPLILVGEGQGAELIRRLLAEYYDKEGENKNLICAYLLDWTFAEGELDALDNLHISEGVSDTGVIVQKKEDPVDRVEAYLLGSVTSPAELVNALGGLDYASARDETITLRKDVALTKTIVISEGEYTILGDGHTLSRAEGMDTDLISVSSVAGSEPSLSLGDTEGGDTLILDGSSGAGSGTKGALVGVYGSAVFNSYDGTVYRNNSRKGYDGGAVYAECAYEENEDGSFTCLPPQVNIFGGEFSKNTTDKHGGALAMVGAYASENGTFFGTLNIYGGKFFENTAQEGANQVYVENADCSYAVDIEFSDTDIDIRRKDS